MTGRLTRYCGTKGRCPKARVKGVAFVLQWDLLGGQTFRGPLLSRRLIKVRLGGSWAFRSERAARISDAVYVHYPLRPLSSCLSSPLAIRLCV